EIYRVAGQGEDARAMYQKALEIRERLATAEPGRADDQRALSVSYIKLGDLYQESSQGEGAGDQRTPGRR
uniref:hypothetical protein n=1 Tax=uncultured Thiodictyon sp. TaxID=1846217 RepID=UPI0025F2A9D0